MGRIAANVATLGRPEIGELAEPDVAGRGGSSTMPQKQNPVLSVLVRRAALTAPGLGATLHTAAALAVDERPDGSWHAEWATPERSLGRRWWLGLRRPSWSPGFGWMLIAWRKPWAPRGMR